MLATRYPAGEHVGEERILRVLDRVAVADDGERKFPEPRIRLHLVVGPHSQIDRNGALPGRIEQIQLLVADAPFADGEIHSADQGAPSSSFPPGCFLIWRGNAPAAGSVVAGKN
jgi:hypothetical protein